jgi:hypothetical protein
MLSADMPADFFTLTFSLLKNKSDLCNVMHMLALTRYKTAAKIYHV